MNATEQTTDVFATVTNLFINLLEKDAVPWKISWSDKGLPINLVTGKPYRGINLWLLNALDYPDNIFLTEHQAKELGGWVRRGEIPNTAVYWEWKESPSESEQTPETAAKATATLKMYRLFNIAQCADIPEHVIPVKPALKKYNPIEVCKGAIAAIPNAPRIRHRGDKAYYQPVLDFINMPSPDSFPNDEYYYATLFNRMVCATGHEKRLNRKTFQAMLPKDFKAYSLEDLIAQIGGCYLCSYCGIDTWNFENRMEYAKGWIEQLQKDSRFIIRAAIQAQKAVDYILDTKQPAEKGKVADEILESEVK